MKPLPNNFDFIRLVAASLVIIGHAYPLLDAPGLPWIMGSSIHTFAVKVFFVLSGYLVVASWMRDPNALRFFAKRALRIMPALIVVVCLSALILGPLVTTLPLSEYFSNPFFWDYFWNISLEIRYTLPGVFENNIYPLAVNGSLWTLPVEVAMYLLVLIVGLIALRASGRFFKLAWMVLTFIFLAIVVVRATVLPDLFQGTIIYATLVTASLDLAPYFMVGGCLSIFEKSIPRSLLVAGALFVAGHMLTGSHAIMSLANVFILSYAVIVFGTSSTPYLRRTGRFGDISYGVYLYGFPVAQTLSWAFGNDIPLIAHMIWALAISYFFAFLSWHLVEKPALTLKPRYRGVERLS